VTVIAICLCYSGDINKRQSAWITNRLSSLTLGSWAIPSCIGPSSRLLLTGFNTAAFRAPEPNPIDPSIDQWILNMFITGQPSGRSPKDTYPSQQLPFSQSLLCPQGTITRELRGSENQ